MTSFQAKFVLTLLLTMEISARAAAQSPVRKRTQPESFTRSMVVGNETIAVFISSIPFRKSVHQIDSSKTKFGISHNGRDTTFLVGRIDGRLIYGTVGNLPRREIDRFEVAWNGKPIRIPKSIYSDCFEPNLQFMEPPPAIQIAASANGSQVLIEMDGSDAAGSYTVWWIISRDGKHTRFIGGGE